MLGRGIERIIRRYRAPPDQTTRVQDIRVQDMNLDNPPLIKPRPLLSHIIVLPYVSRYHAQYAKGELVSE